MPTQYWHEKYPSWPAIAAVHGQDLAEQSGVAHAIQMSPLPRDADSCNYSCSSWRGYRTNEMNFRVTLALNHSALSQGYVHTVYPVLLASADFNDWWVVADRRHSWPSPFWRARTDVDGHAYTYETESCIRPPVGTQLATKASAGLYVLACLVWSPDSFAELENLDELDDAALGTHCYSAGGVCGWTCDSVLNPDLMEGCSADSVIQMTASSVGGREIPTANFKGTVEMKQCLNGKMPGACEAATEKFQHWQCHECLYDPRTEEDIRRLQIIPGIGGLPPGLDDPDGGLPGFGGDTGGGGSGGFGDGDPDGSSQAKTPIVYTSLPRFRVTVSGMPVPEGTDVLSQPRVFILQSSRERSKWQKLYQAEYTKTDPPVPVGPDGQPLVKQRTDEYDEELLPVKDPVSKHAMKLNRLNRLEIEPGWCYGRQGPMYLVACAVNSSLYEDGFDRFKPGQQAAPPPFNDRCVAVSGRCAHVCQSDQEPLGNCSADACTQLKGLSDVR